MSVPFVNFLTSPEMSNTLTHHIKSLKACLLQPPSVFCQLNYAEWRGMVFCAPLEVIQYILENTYTHTQPLSLSHQLNHMWLCISKPPLHVSSVVFSPQRVSVWCRVAGSHFKSALSVPDIKDTILNLFDHENSTYIQVDSPTAFSRPSTFTILHYLI